MWSPTSGPNEFVRRGALRHSQGPWEDHKYVKKVDDKYYYPNSYEDGRTISDLKGEDKKDSNRSEKSSYSKDDSDFDEKNYSDKNLLGDTDFYGFKGKDGRNVILMEDKKWTLPEGVKLDAKLKKRLEAVTQEIEKRRERGENVTGEEWDKLVDDAIDGVNSSKKKGSSKKSGSSKKGSKSSGKSKQQSDRERRAKNKATIKKRTEEQLEEKKRRMARNKMQGKEYLNHSSIWDTRLSSDELYHFGILGQKWGHKNGPPYPLDAEDHSAAEKKAKKKSWSERRAEKKKKKTQQKNLKKARKAQQEKRDAAKKKEEILKKGSAADIAKIKDQLTAEDYRDVFTRLDNEDKLNQRINRNMKTGQEKFNTIVSTVGTLALASQNAINLYNNGAKVYNAFNKAGKKAPIIGESRETQEQKLKKYLTDKADIDTVAKNKEKLNNKELNMALQRFKTMDAIEEYKKLKKG
jgi:hypothetical protein